MGSQARLHSNTKEMRWHLFCKRAGGNIKCNFTGYLGASCADKRLSMATLLSGVEFFNNFFGGGGDAAVEERKGGRGDVRLSGAHMLFTVWRLRRTLSNC